MKKTLRALSTASLYSTLLFGALPARSSCGNLSASITNLPALPGNTYQAAALNSAGQITGYFYNDSVPAEAFLYSSGNIIDLGNLGGNISQGLAINSAGIVVGDAITADGAYDAALFDGRNIADLGSLGGFLSSANGINDVGQVIGTSYATDNVVFEGFFFSNGSIDPMGTLGGNFSAPLSLNNQGVAVGESTDTNGNYNAFSFSGGVLKNLGTLGGQYSAAFSINDAGLIVGESSVSSGEIHPFIYSDGVMTDLGNLGGSYAGAYFINQSNQISGEVQLLDGSYHSFFFENGTMTDLGTLGGPNVYPNAMNDLGQVIGQADTESGGSHAFIWQKGNLVDLNTLLPTNSGWELTSAHLINNAGRIVGTGTLNGTDQTFIMDVQLGNNPPTAVAASDQTVECGTLVTLDGSNSSDPDGDSLSFEWTCAGVVLGTNSTLSGYFATGTNTVILKVTDPCGAYSTATVTVTVHDTIAPQLTAPPMITLVAGTNCDAAVPDLSTYIQGSDNCSPASALKLLQQPSAGTLIGVGAHPVQVSLSDEAGNVSAATVVIDVQDQTAPVILSAPGLITVAVGNDCQGVVPNAVSNVVAFDSCTSAGQLVITQDPAPGSIVAKGQSTIVVTVTDLAGNHTLTNVTLNAVDQTAPVIQSASVSPNLISNVNHKMVPVTVSVSATDNCDPAPVSKIVSITCNETVQAGEIVITGPLTASVAATRNGAGGGRVYTLIIQSTDNSGNSSQTTVTVTVPQGNGKK